MIVRSIRKARTPAASMNFVGAVSRVIDVTANVNHFEIARDVTPAITGGVFKELIGVPVKLIDEVGRVGLIREMPVTVDGPFSIGLHLFADIDPRGAGELGKSSERDSDSCVGRAPSGHDLLETL